MFDRMRSGGGCVYSWWGRGGALSGSVQLQLQVGGGGLHQHRLQHVRVHRAQQHRVRQHRLHSPG